MKFNRRQFLRGAVLGSAASIAESLPVKASFEPVQPSEEAFAILVDIPKCIGCRKCEWACHNEPSNGFRSKLPMKYFEDTSVFEKRRQHSEDSLCVVNRYQSSSSGKPIYVKTQCMHCVDPSCLSACLVTAFHKESNGAVSYDAWKCMGCRYCIVACPFEIPWYEYEKPLTPRVRKCTLCFQERTSKGKLPACVEICPTQCLSFGKRTNILRLAREKIESQPDEYINYIYGENEVGGCTWLYISKEPFENLGFLNLPDEAPPRLIEGIQHSIFKYFIPPIMLYGLLGAAMWNFRPDTPPSPNTDKENVHE